jgi:hypothetical protein
VAEKECKNSLSEIWKVSAIAECLWKVWDAVSAIVLSVPAMETDTRSDASLAWMRIARAWVRLLSVALLPLGPTPTGVRLFVVPLPKGPCASGRPFLHCIPLLPAQEGVVLPGVPVLALKGQSIRRMFFGTYFGVWGVQRWDLSQCQVH